MSSELDAGSASPKLQRLPINVPKELIASARSKVEELMSRPPYDASHDFTHVVRVNNSANRILEAEKTAAEKQGSEQEVFPFGLNQPLIELVAWTHDIGDRKYRAGYGKLNNLPEGSAAGLKQYWVVDEGDHMLLDFLLGCNWGDQDNAQNKENVINAVLTMARCVSWSYTLAHQEEEAQVISLYPELKVVQDADRLDALGAVGIARCFSFNAAKGSVGSTGIPSSANSTISGMDTSIAHAHEKLLKLASKMKTQEGRRLADERTERIVKFMQWWSDEA